MTNPTSHSVEYVESKMQEIEKTKVDHDGVYWFGHIELENLIATVAQEAREAEMARILQSIKDTNFLKDMDKIEGDRGIKVYRRIRDHIKALSHTDDKTQTL